MPRIDFDLAVARAAPGVTFEVADCALFILSAPNPFTLRLDSGDDVQIDTNSPVRTIKKRDGQPIGMVAFINAAGAGTAVLFYDTNYTLRIG